MTMMNEQRKRRQQQTIQQIRDLARAGQWQEAKQLADKLPDTPDTQRMKERIEKQLIITTSEVRTVMSDDTPLVSASTRRESSSNKIWMIVIWVTLVILVAIIAGVAGYKIAEQNVRSEYELPIEFESLFVDVCTANSDLTASQCSGLARASWKLYQSKTLDCFTLYLDTDMTNGEFLQCIADVGD